jgi:hypothetical protein
MADDDMGNDHSSKMSHINSQSLTWQANDPDEARKVKYLQLCTDVTSGSSSSSSSDPTITAPLFSWSARQALIAQGQVDLQHALLGHHQPSNDKSKEPILLNTAHPWSAFICGSQGSGKSYTTSCILEGVSPPVTRLVH